MSSPSFAFAEFTPAESSPSAPRNTSDQEKNGALDVLKRKRERDKQSQRRKRQRERDYTASLLERIQQLENRLEDTIPRNQDASKHQETLENGRSGESSSRDALEERVNSLSDVVKDLVDVFQGRHTKGADLLRQSLEQGSCPSTLVVLSPGSERSPPSERKISDAHDVELMQPQPTSTGFVRSILSSLPPDILISSNDLNRLLLVPEWLRIPLYISTPLHGPEMLSRGQRLAAFVQELRTSRVPNIALLCPAQPKPMDLLYGGSSNILANFVNVEIRHEPFLPPERFAASWLLYLYFRVSAHSSPILHCLYF